MTHGRASWWVAGCSGALLFCGIAGGCQVFTGLDSLDAAGGNSAANATAATCGATPPPSEFNCTDAIDMCQTCDMDNTCVVDPVWAAMQGDTIILNTMGSPVRLDCDAATCGDKNIRCVGPNACEVTCNGVGACTANQQLECAANATCKLTCSDMGCDPTFTQRCGDNGCELACFDPPAPTQACGDACHCTTAGCAN